MATNVATDVRLESLWITQSDYGENSENERKMRGKRGFERGEYKVDHQLCIQCLFSRSCWVVVMTEGEEEEEESCDCREDWGEAGIIKVVLDEWVSRDEETEGKRIRGRELEKPNMTWKKAEAVIMTGGSERKIREGDEGWRKENGSHGGQTGHVKARLCLTHAWGKLKILLITSGHPTVSPATSM